MVYQFIYCSCLLFLYYILLLYTVHFYYVHLLFKFMPEKYIQTIDPTQDAPQVHLKSSIHKTKNEPWPKIWGTMTSPLPPPPPPPA